MHSLLTSTDTTTNNKQIITSGSLVYDGAINAILSDDVETALKNPIFNRHWMDLVWVFYRGKQSRFMEQVYCTHNAARRVLARTNPDISLEGTEYEAEEKEQLACTAEMNSMDDSVFLRTLNEDHTKRFDDDQDLFWRSGLCSFLSSIDDVQSFLVGSIKSLLENVAVDENEESKSMKQDDDDEQEIMLRFMFHLVFLLDVFTDCDDDDDTDSNKNLKSFKENVIEPYHDELLLLYLKRLTMHKTLWKFTCLYASLLPMDRMIDFLTNFWMTSIHDDNSRCMVLNQARACLSDGLDLVIARRVVRGRIAMATTEGSISLNALPANVMKDIQGGVENKILHDDLEKMHSIHWLCMHPEHYADALVCANMLLRHFLLQVDQGNENETIGDWSGDSKLRSAKVFKTRFLPPDFIEKVFSGGGIDEGNDNNQVSANKMCLGELKDYNYEFECFGAFLEAHSAYEAWKSVIVSLPAEVDFESDGKFIAGSLEREISLKMDKRNYIQKKKNSGFALIKVAEGAYNKMMRVLLYEGGFLNCEPTEIEVVHSLEEMKQRSDELSTLQKKCVQLMVYLTYRVLTETAHWMNDFVEDIMQLFHNETLDVLSRIHMIQDDDESNYPFLPETWHSKASNIANIINDNDIISACFQDDDIEYLQSLMSETETHLNKCKERNI